MSKSKKSRRECAIFIGNSRSGTHALHSWIIDQNSKPWKLIKIGGAFAEEAEPAYRQRVLKLIDTQNLLAFESRPIIEVEECIKWLSKNGIEYKFVFILLRDPFNWLASFCNFIHKFRSKRTRKFPHNRPRHQIDIWKTYAHQFVTPQIPRTICVSYNSWVSNASYRKTISKQVGDRFSETKVTVPGGSRSSFNEPKTKQNASKRKVFDRWKDMEKPYLKFMLDPELLMWCKRIFGETEAYIHFSSMKNNVEESTNNE